MRGRLLFVVAFALTMFVGIVWTIQTILSLKAAAPTPSKALFVVVPVIVMGVFIALGWREWRSYRFAISSNGDRKAPWIFPTTKKGYRGWPKWDSWTFSWYYHRGPK